MSEVVISRRGGSSSGSGKNMVTEYITFNRNWTVPKANEGEKITIRIGRIDDYNANLNPSVNALYDGGTTSFGTYLSANGGANSTGGSGGGGFGTSSRAYQFGGGSGGGNGGVWGGGGGKRREKADGSGHGGYYGGGGGGCVSGYPQDEGAVNGGNGGYYGGGGGGGQYPNYYPIQGGIGGVYNDNGTLKRSGLAGNGGRGHSTNYLYTNSYLHTNGENGTNTIGLSIVDDMGYSLTGAGIAGITSNQYFSGDRYHNFGGGGGGRDGGNGANASEYGGGGGGYGSNGGHGGGGYGGDGGDYGGGGYGKVSIGREGGGGYYCPGGGINNTNGGGGIGIWDGNELIASYGSGGSNYRGGAEPGICIIKYYAD